MKYLMTIFILLFACGEEPPSKPNSVDIPKNQGLSNEKPEIIVRSENVTINQVPKPELNNSEQPAPVAGGNGSNLPTSDSPNSDQQNPTNPPNNDTNPASPPSDPETTNQFIFRGIGSEGIYALNFENIPQNAFEIWIYWGYDSELPFTKIPTNQQTNFTSKPSWGFDNKLDIKCEVYDSDGKKLTEYMTILIPSS